MTRSPTAYRCRDCGHGFTPAKPTSKCPQCGSIYLLPAGFRPPRRPRTLSIQLGDRFLSLVLGTVFGMLTFFIWGVALLVNAGPGAAKAAAGAFFLGLKWSVAFGVGVGIAGFILGEEKLARLLGILWGTDEEFNDRLNDRFHSAAYSIPNWVVYLFLVLAIAGSYGYLATQL